MRRFLAIGMSFVAGSAMSVLVNTARAETTDETTSAALARADTAQRNADAARARAAELEKMGSPAYKSGLMRGAMWEAARYQAQADEARAVAAGVTPAPVSPELQDARERLENLKKMGGSAYKSGAVRWAELDVRALEGAAQTTVTSETEEPVPADSGKPVERAESEAERAYK